MDNEKRLALSSELLNAFCSEIDAVIAKTFGVLTLSEIVGVLEVTKQNLIQNALFANAPENPNREEQP